MTPVAILCFMNALGVLEAGDSAEAIMYVVEEDVACNVWRLKRMLATAKTQLRNPLPSFLVRSLSRDNSSGLTDAHR